MLEIKGTHVGGSIYISEGSIIHAEAGDSVGRAGAHTFARAQGWPVQIETFHATFAAEHRRPMEGLLMAAVQASDEQAGEHAAQAGAKSSGASPSDRRVEEVVLISATGEILYQRNAPEAEKRVTLLDWIGRSSASVGKTFPALGATGPFENSGHRHPRDLPVPAGEQNIRAPLRDAAPIRRRCERVFASIVDGKGVP